MIRWFMSRRSVEKSNMRVILESGKREKFRWQLYEGDEFAGIAPPRGFETERDAYKAAKKAFGNRHPIYGVNGQLYREK